MNVKMSTVILLTLLGFTSAKWDPKAFNKLFIFNHDQFILFRFLLKREINVLLLKYHPSNEIKYFK